MKFNYISNGKSKFFPKFCKNSEHYLLDLIKPHSKDDEAKKVINQYLHQEVKQKFAIKDSILKADEIQGNSIFFQNAMASAVQTQRFPIWIKSHFFHLLKDNRNSIAGNAFCIAYESITKEAFTGYLPQRWLEQHPPRSEGNGKNDSKDEVDLLDGLIEEIAIELMKLSATKDDDKQSLPSKRSLYIRLAKTGVQFLSFIQTWGGAKNLILTLDELYSNAENHGLLERYKILCVHLPLLFTRINGIKTVMAQYILKELGYPSAKNDVHIKRILGVFKENGLLQNIDSKDDINSNLIFLEISQTLPASTGSSLTEKIYYLDKLFWLLNNRNFYLHKALQKKLKVKGKTQEATINKLLKQSL